MWQPGTPEPRQSPENPVGSIHGCPRKPLEETDLGPRKEHLMDPTPVWAAMALGSKIPDWFSHYKLLLSVAEINFSSQTQMYKKCSPIFCICFHSIPAPIPRGWQKLDLSKLKPFPISRVGLKLQEVYVIPRTQGLKTLWFSLTSVPSGDCCQQQGPSCSGGLSLTCGLLSGVQESPPCHGVPGIYLNAQL